MSTLQEMFESYLFDVLADKDASWSSDDLKTKVTDMVPGVVESLSAPILARIKKNYPATAEEQWRNRQEFEERLWSYWQEPLVLLDLFISVATEAGDVCTSDLRKNGEIPSANLVDAITRLHARACQLSSAIFLLLRSGFADDAYARWRSLHEIAVVGSFIGEHGEKLAERYLLHDIVQRYKLASTHRDHADLLNEDLISQTEFENLKSMRGELIHRFGSAFSEDYGWAECVLETKHPTLKDIECSVGLEHWRPFYRMASDNVHANAHAIYSQLGVNQTPQDILLAGPSNMGLVDPGHSTAISLMQITVALLTIEPSLDHLVYSSILEKLQAEIGKSFLEVHNKLESLAESENDGTA